MEIINISDAKTQLSSLIEKILNGEEVVIGKAGKPIAKLIKYNEKEVPRKPEALKGKITISDDFDELPADLKSAFGVIESE